MAELRTIPQIQSSASTDYERLRTQSIGRLQDISGSIWTDYNEHDPGVTMLEALCYLITELFQRTDIPIADLLTDANGNMQTESNALYSAADILHNDPLTPADYRKMIIDSVEEVNNAWVLPDYLSGTATDDRTGIAGLYNIYADLHKIDSPPATVRQVMKKIENVVNSCRNVGEKFHEPVNLEHSPVTLKTNIYLIENADPEQILAQIIVDIEAFFRPGIQFRNYQEMVAMGLATDEIFNGPRLTHGFISDDQLVDKSSVFYPEYLFKLITSYKQVSSVSVSLWPDQAEKIDIGPDQILYLDVPGSIRPDNLTIYVNRVKYSFNPNIILSNYYKLKGDTHRPRRYIPEEQKLNIPAITGTQYPQAELYYSIQNEFPLIYGIGNERLSPKATEARKAQALQLKAYLLLFEQLLSDFMKQASELGNVFSINKQTQTFFFQPLYSVPDVHPLLAGFRGRATEIYNTGQSDQYLRHSRELEDDKSNDYITGLAGIYDAADLFDGRRNAFLDHLLARFNFSLYSFSPEGNPDIARLMDDDITIKESLLQNIKDITASRGSIASPNISQGGDLNVDHFGVEQILRILSGLDHQKFENMKLDNFELIFPKRGEAKEVILRMNEGGKKVHIDLSNIEIHDLCQAGMSKQSYRVYQKDGHEEIYLRFNHNNVLVYTQPEHSQLTADTIISRLMGDFLKVYLQYENMFFVEHINLLPAFDKARFTWVNTADPAFAKPEQMAYTEILQSIKDHFSLPEIPWPKIRILVSTGQEGLVSQYFYSSRVSIFLPQKAVNPSGADFLENYLPFVKYFHFLVTTNFPAHVAVNVFWLDEDEYSDFQKLYAGYAIGSADAKDAMLQYLLATEEYKSYANGGAQ